VGAMAPRRSGEQMLKKKFAPHQKGRKRENCSRVCPPWGHVIAKASDGVGIVSARLDPARVKRVRALIPLAQHRVRLTPD